ESGQAHARHRDAARLRTGERLDVFAGSDPDDAAAADRDRLGFRTRGVEGHEAPQEQDVGALVAHATGEEQRGDQPEHRLNGCTGGPRTSGRRWTPRTSTRPWPW